MTNKNVLIKNIYYMLAYAFSALEQKKYEKIEAEDFDYVEDLLAKILSIGVSSQLKRGLYNEYILKSENLRVLRGRLNLGETIKNRSRNNRQELFCEHDNFSENNLLNKILKATIIYLSKNRRVKSQTRKELKKLLLFFQNVEELDLRSVPWTRLQFHQNNKTYVMLINICYFVFKDMLLSEEIGKSRVLSFSEEHLEHLYEKFIWEYYHRHHKELKMGKLRVFWDLPKEREESLIKFLPRMKSDVKLIYEDKTLIIDAKYYSRITQEQFGTVSVRNGHLYQIFSYVKNEDKENTGKVSGMLLYAKTINETIPLMNEIISGNKISVCALDLNQPFLEIKRQLDSIVEGWKSS